MSIAKYEDEWPRCAGCRHNIKKYIPRDRIFCDECVRNPIDKRIDWYDISEEDNN